MLLSDASRTRKYAKHCKKDSKGCVLLRNATYNSAERL